ncbi:MAG: helix-turn-helix domain containing protein [Candidatus Thiodiazotropha sp. (ex Dulcina madagascariensis)]|nr:helix-turn-helix domain containing protein [Candidatus Thiodiazotropha sp. (ex Dulcina madagascariensis)]
MSEYHKLRFEEEVNRLGVTKISRQLGVARNTIYNWLANGNVPMDKLLSIGAMGADVQYILTGARSKNIYAEAEKTTTPAPNSQKKDKNTRTLSDEQKMLLDTWFKVPTPAKATVMALLNELIPHTDFGDTPMKFLDPDKVDDMTDEELEEHQRAYRLELKRSSPAFKKAEKRRAEARRRRQKEKEKL